MRCVRSDCQEQTEVIAARAEKYAQIAQLVEQRTENPRVTGSIPVLGIFFICGNVLRVKVLGIGNRKSKARGIMVLRTIIAVYTAI